MEKREESDASNSRVIARNTIVALCNNFLLTNQGARMAFVFSAVMMMMNRARKGSER